MIKNVVNNQHYIDDGYQVLVTDGYQWLIVVDQQWSLDITTTSGTWRVIWAVSIRKEGAVAHMPTVRLLWSWMWIPRGTGH